MVFSSGANRLEKQLTATKIINTALVVIMLSIFIGGLVIGIYNLFTIPRYETTRIPLGNTVYECDHYPNGDMECFDLNDPDVGFGQSMP